MREDWRNFRRVCSPNDEISTNQQKKEEKNVLEWDEAMRHLADDDIFWSWRRLLSSVREIKKCRSELYRAQSIKICHISAIISCWKCVLVSHFSPVLFIFDSLTCLLLTFFLLILEKYKHDKKRRKLLLVHRRRRHHVAVSYTFVCTWGEKEIQ